ncbi:hypothetical protein K437DRAFT_164453 [Tilletiaria anomala UBC 951]|uniref:Uncharacterized protein n=1 Tax=Tilletiaria anomala (strain ATCC 24038 / CBS 436.72 / UBC 951) TaxID=1037660 RepID=A0A066VL13_TILAU|nr:uncharacterized protein K437DRAFT_164453 [Tilletiaria anomala UBC 951]KDN42402.1 hypothetical protein K437DRAFT_164453 [Tilletiaria anomala UBC 951]
MAVPASQGAQPPFCTDSLYTDTVRCTIEFSSTHTSRFVVVISQDAFRREPDIGSGCMCRDTVIKGRDPGAAWRSQSRVILWRRSVILAATSREYLADAAHQRAPFSVELLVIIIPVGVLAGALRRARHADPTLRTCRPGLCSRYRPGLR